MNVNAVFTNRPAPKAEPSMRSEVAARGEDVARGDDVQRTDERGAVRKPKKPSQAEFSALLALLAGAGPQVRAELHAQVPSDRSSLIDSLLNGALTSLPIAEAQADGYSEYAPLDTTGGLASQNTNSGTQSDTLKENVANGVTAALRALTAVGARSGDDHAQEVLSRITARHAAPVEQLKARGDKEAADMRMALDALLSHAGTQSGFEIAAAADITASGSAANNAALTAAAAALATAKAVSSADVTTPVRDTSALAPDLSQRLDRVIARMKAEHGHDVQVMETARSQERQDFLYEQGRTRPGAVVTWTRDSAHTQGTAVDVIVDGAWNNTEGFARLQRIAREEGLRTLGARDPGHLELESSAATGGQDVAVSREPTVQRATVSVATSAAGRAGVAQVAGVAGVAQVAAPGAGRGYTRGVEQTNSTPATAPAGTVAAPASANGQGNAFGRGAHDEEGKPLNDARRLGVERRESLGGTETAAFGAMQGSATSTNVGVSDAAAPAAGVASAERVADMQALRDSAPAGSVSRLTLNVDAADGGQDRITVDLRGNSVGTQISTDMASAERLRMRTAELQDALGRHGLESESVQVAGVARAEKSDAARTAIGDRDALRVGVAQNAATNDSLLNQGQRDRAANAREWDRPDTSRQARDERRESARQGAGQSDQRETPYRSNR